MRRNERTNIIIGLLVIVFALAGIVVMLVQLFKPGVHNTGAKNSRHESTVSEKNPMTDAATPIPTQTPTPSPSPTPSQTPVPSTVSLPVKGLYLTAKSVETMASIQRYVDLANNTEINAYVIDVKDDDGEICYETKVSLAVKHNAWKKKYDVRQVLDTFHENNIKVIGRVVCFSDPLMPLKEPDMSLKNKSGTVFKVPLGEKHLAWLDPSNKDAWQYIIDISKEAFELGFDEIQYDYIRFPETTNFKYDMSHLEKEKSDYINDFIQFAKAQLDGSILSGDIFGSVCIQSRDAGGIGQTLETISRHFDYISPMIYPSHYANDSKDHYSGNGMGTNINGVLYRKPDLEPYYIIYNTLLITKKRLDDAGLDVKVRPYLQGFTADYMPEDYYIKYGVDEYRAQIQAVYDAGYEEWIFWNSRNTYVKEAFLPEE
ncbi:MAG: hypothetical protein GX045_08245 [Clostridiaceae bacterium]|nr:hypothetical protein [Clostridiaceae bacterium]